MPTTPRTAATRLSATPPTPILWMLSTKACQLRATTAATATSTSRSTSQLRSSRRREVAGGSPIGPLRALVSSATTIAPFGRGIVSRESSTAVGLSTGEHPVVQRFERPGRSLPTEALSGLFGCPLADRRSPGRIVQERDHGRGQSLWIPGRDEDPGPAVLNRIRYAAHAGRHDGRARSLCLHHRKALRLEPGRDGNHVGRGEPVDHLGRIGPARLIDYVVKPQIDGKARHRVGCLLYTSPSPRDRQKSRMPSSA